MAGNILIGGFIGAGVDAATGAGYDYPTVFQVMMGQQVTAPAVVSQAAAPQAAAPAEATKGGMN